jgi:GxxExxY protein
VVVIFRSLNRKRMQIHATELPGRRRREEMIEEGLTERIIGAAIEVHKHWGPGLYEEVYERSMRHELRLRNVPFETQVQLPLVYKGERVGDDLRLDLIVQATVVVELKAIKELEPIHEAQLLTYMKLTRCRVGLLINFNVPVLKQGIKRMVL